MNAYDDEGHNSVPTDAEEFENYVETIVEQKVDERVEDLREENEQLRERVDGLEEENEQLRERVDELEEDQTPPGLIDALRRKANSVKDALRELQGRELEKGAHLREENIVPDEIDVEGGKLEKVTKDDGKKYVRVPGSEDALNRGGSVALAHEDLLPIQQLSRLDEDMLASEARPVQLAVRYWQQRDEDRGPWKNGSKKVRHYVEASELARAIQIDETGVSKQYAQKLASRTMEAMRDLTNDRVIRKKKERTKDGLTYQESRLIVPSDVEIPGEAPQTDGVDG